MTDRELIASLLALCERFGTGHGHLDNREAIDFRGVCVGHRQYDASKGRRVRTGTSYQIVDQPITGVCAPSCQQWQQAVQAARAWLAEREPRQLELVS